MIFHFEGYFYNFPENSKVKASGGDKLFRRNNNANQSNNYNKQKSH